MATITTKPDRPRGPQLDNNIARSATAGTLARTPSQEDDMSALLDASLANSAWRPVNSNGADDGLSALVHMHMLNPDNLRTAVS